MFTVSLLGAPSLERDGTPVYVDTRKAVALLAYLAVTDQVHTRDALANLLYPDYDSERGRAALRRTLSTLRGALPEDALEAARSQVGLRAVDDLTIDVIEFARCLDAAAAHHPKGEPPCEACVGQLDRAVRLYRGDLLTGFGLRDSVNFDDWHFFAAEDLRQRLTGALDRLIESHASAGRLEGAIEMARRRLAIDSLYEPVHRRLIGLYARAGRRNAALRQYHDCVRVLDRELGVAPLHETTALYQAVMKRTIGAEGQGAGKSSSGPDASPPARSRSETTATGPTEAPPATPLVGRESELEALDGAFVSIREDGRLVALVGEAGVGKTRLAEEFLDQLRERRAPTASARSYEDERTLAYASITAALRSARDAPGAADRIAAVEGHHVAEAARLVPELATGRSDIPEPPPLDGPGAQGRFFAGVAEVLATALGGNPAGAVLFDDIHWADEASLDALTFMVRRLSGRPLLIIVTWRGEAVTPGSRPTRMFTDARRAMRADLVEVGRLSAADVGVLLDAASPHLEGKLAAGQAGSSSELVDRLRAETGGLPLLLVEYLAALGRGELPDPPERGAPAPPPGVRDLLRARLAGLNETASQVIAAAAIAGGSFDFDTTRAASGRSEEEVVAAIEVLLSNGVIVERGHEGGIPVYDFTHETVRTVVLDDTSLARRRLLHARVASALAGRARPGGEDAAVPSLIAHHFQLGGHEAEAADWLVRAGDRARELFANVEALEHFEAALALGHPDVARLHTEIGDLRTLHGDYDRAVAEYEAAAACAEPESRPMIERKLGEVHERLGGWELAQSHLEAALEALGAEGEAGIQATLEADLARVTQRRGSTEDGRAHAQAARRHAERAGDRRALARADNVLGLLDTEEGELDRARDRLEQSLASAEEAADIDGQIAALNNLARVLSLGDELDQAIGLAERALELCQARGDRHREAALHSNVADLLQARGRAEEAVEHLKEAAPIFADVHEGGPPRPEIWKLVAW